MLVAEARAIGELLARLPASEIDPCLNLGSSTADFRQRVQPHIDVEVFAPLRQRGITVLHADMKAADGVDLVGDIFDPAFKNRLRDLSPKLIICSNLLEHLTDPVGFAKSSADILPRNGWILVTVPHSFPYHDDPIDNGLRPTPGEIAALFPALDLAEEQVVIAENYLSEFLGLPIKAKARRIVGDAIRIAMLPFLRKRAILNRFHRYLWMFRPYKASIALLRRGAVGSA
jgi:hypothetical protein